ncbi:hypothetical protein ACFWJS_33870 [Streptomyces sp. NPDC127061]|uniref:hypothetical protein n=1 Tax=Streptomyces sp. NPDC127061 TaxID=3347122 RepID=UPI00366875E6
MTDTTLHTITGAGPTPARFLTPTPVPTTYKGVVIPDHVRRLWDESLGRIWRRTVDATREAVAAEVRALDYGHPGLLDMIAGEIAGEFSSRTCAAEPGTTPA